MSRLVPPSGVNPPAWFEAAGHERIDLGALAGRLCDLYYDVHPDDAERYGDAGRAWCEHDSRYLLAWALEDARAGAVDAVEQVRWLGRVLAGRGFPVERLADHAELTAAVLGTAVAAPLGERAAERMTAAARSLREGVPAARPG